ncbi:MAG: neutral zinc metallopeptidase [Planctomycetia bacterium]|nr:neutral zinc metallopeptidase [Planctomycetia bacterium]
MRLDDAPQSGNVSDIRGMGGKLAVGGAGGIILLILGLIFGTDITGGRRVSNNPPDEKTRVFVSKVLGTTEEVWEAEFKKMGRRYKPPKLTIFSDQVRTGCGVAPSSVGPFYCPADQTIYIDPTFFDELEQKLGGSKAEFSQAYVIAHEVGHHVQRLLGYTAEPGNDQESVRLELQADYLAGVWAHHGQKRFNFIEPGDVEAALTSAKAIGDDRLQKRSGGFVHPEKFTHGTSRQRVYFFKRGLETGDVSKATLSKFFTVRMNRNGELQDF